MMRWASFQYIYLEIDCINIMSLHHIQWDNLVPFKLNSNVYNMDPSSNKVLDCGGMEKSDASNSGGIVSIMVVGCCPMFSTRKQQ